MTSGQLITWDDVRDIPYTDLVIGDRYIVPAVGTAYHSSPDGTVRGVVWTPLEGTVWTVVGRDGDVWTARRDGGFEGTARPRASSTALRITARESR